MIILQIASMSKKNDNETIPVIEQLKGFWIQISKAPEIAKGRGGSSIPGWSDFLSDCFKLKLKRWRIT